MKRLFVILVMGVLAVSCRTTEERAELKSDTGDSSAVSVLCSANNSFVEFIPRFGEVHFTSTVNGPVQSGKKYNF